MPDTIGIATNKSVLDLYNGIRSGELILHPDFQRKLVWNNEHKQKFIRTILEGLPFPEIYIAAGTIDVEAGRGTTLIVDGQQRLNTIYEYVTSAPSFKLTEIPPFADIDRESFFDYKVTVRDLGRLENQKIVDIFARINSVGYALNAVEVNNALYDGPFIKTAQRLAATPLLNSFDVYTEAEFTRMRDLEFFLLLMAILEAGDYFGQDREVETCIKQFNSDYPNQEKAQSAIIASLKFLSQSRLADDSFWFRKSNFFTITAELAIWYWHGRQFFPSEIFRSELEKLGETIQANKSEAPDNPYARYYKYVYQGTSGRVARRERGKMVRDFLLTLPRLDPLVP